MSRVRMASRLAAAFIVGIAALAVAHAADSRLDDANAHLVKARELVAAAQPSDAAKDYQQHTKRAIDLINQAIREIELAKGSAGANLSIHVPSTGIGRPLNPSGLVQLNPQPEPPAPAQ